MDIPFVRGEFTLELSDHRQECRLGQPKFHDPTWRSLMKVCFGFVFFFLGFFVCLFFVCLVGFGDARKKSEKNGSALLCHCRQGGQGMPSLGKRFEEDTIVFFF